MYVPRVSDRTRWLAVLVAVLLAACSSSASSPGETSDGPTTVPRRRPTVEPATLEGPVTVGQLSLPADPRPLELDAIGYTQEEFFASGTATAYTAKGTLGANGRWTSTPTTKAPYKTRFVVRRPADPARFSGTVVLEWLNVTAVEAAPEWAYTQKALVDAGAAWVGVSVQALGVVGGTSLMQTGSAEQQQQTSGGLRGNNPERYGSLAHPGDQYAFDIFSQVGTAFRSPGDVKVLGPSKARRVIASGESQSAAYLSGYINAIQPVADVFDGFFVHSRGSGAAKPDGALDSRGSAPYRFRTDLDVPVMAFETETDVGPLLGYAKARQPDTAHVRTWEVAGTTHADAYLVGGNFSFCPGGINNGPHHYVATAAMSALIRWVEKGDPPPHSTRIETSSPNSTTIVRDQHGLAKGGIRTPSVDVPVSTLTAEAAPGAPVLCALFGGSKPFDHDTLTALYRTKRAYLAKFDKALDRVIARGFVRRADRAEYEAEARAVQF